MTLRSTALIFIGFYQFVRTLVLLIAVIVQQQLSGGGSSPGLILALGVGALVPALLILQLRLTGASAILPPLRVALFLQLLGSLLLAASSRGVGLPPGIPSAAVLAAASLLVLADTASLVFLLSWKARVNGTRVSAEDTAGGAGFTVEELED